MANIEINQVAGSTSEIQDNDYYVLDRLSLGYTTLKILGSDLKAVLRSGLLLLDGSLPMTGTLTINSDLLVEGSGGFGTTTPNAKIHTVAEGASKDQILRRYSTNAAISLIGEKAGGTESVPLDLLDNENLFVVGVNGFVDGAFTNNPENVAILQYEADGDWITASTGVKISLKTTPNGSTIRQTVWEAQGDDFKFTSIPSLPSFTVAGLPSPVGREGAMIYVSDESGGKTTAFSDNVNWLRSYDRAIVS